MPSGLSETMGSSFGALGTYALAAVVVLVLLLVVMFVAKRAMGGGATAIGTRKGPRLAVIDVAAIDQRRKLVLVRRDDVEHLVLVGGENDVVVEAGILRSAAASRPAPAGLRSDPEMAAGTPRAQPAAIAPEPRAPEPRARALEAGNGARPASPLRRVVPGADAPRHQDDQKATPPADKAQVAVSGPEERPEQALWSEAPAVGPAVVAPPPKRETPPPSAAVPPEPRETIQAGDRRPVAADTPASPPAAAPAPSRNAAETERAASAPIEPEPRVPEFLRRGPEPREETPPAKRPPVVVPPVAAPPAPAPRGPLGRDPVMSRANPSIAAAAAPIQPPAPAAQPAPVVPRPQAFEPPVVGPSEPVPPQSRNTTPPMQVQPQPQSQPQPVAPPAPTPEARFFFDPASQPQPAGDPAERQPLSVRSFASAIQSRRTPEAPRQEAPAPVVAPPPAPPAPSRREPEFAQRQVAEEKRAVPPASAEPDIDDALSRGLDDDLSSLDWGGESRQPKPAPAVRPEPAVASPAPAPAPVVATAKPNAAPERRLTLEEEMERLLGDFDFGANKR